MNDILFEFFGNPISSMLLFEAFAVLLTFLCIVAAVKEKVLTFPLGMIGTAMYFYIFFMQRVYSSMLLQVMFFVFNAYGLYRWTHPARGYANDNNQLAVTVCTRKQRFICAIVIFLLAMIWGYTSSNLHLWFPLLFPEPAKYAYIDAFILSASLTAQYLMAVKKLENWVLWFSVDIVAAPFYAFTVGWFTGGLYLVFIFTAIMGFLQWYKSYKKGLLKMQTLKCPINSKR